MSRGGDYHGKELQHIRFFKDIGVGDVSLAEGKVASLGQIYKGLIPKSSKILDGLV
jgi:hypothetical protein